MKAEWSSSAFGGYMNSLLKRYFAEENLISPGAVELRAAWRTSRFVYCVCPFTGRITGQVLRDGGGTNFTLMQVRNVLVRWWTRLQTGSVWLPVTTGLSPPLPYDFSVFCGDPRSATVPSVRVPRSSRPTHAAGPEVTRRTASGSVAILWLTSRTTLGSSDVGM